MQSLPDVQLIRRHTLPAALRASAEKRALHTMLRLLSPDERRLAEMVLINRQSHRAAAAEFSVVPGVVTRRVCRLRNRLACPVRRALAVHLDTLPQPMRDLAVEHFFAGVSRAALARNLSLPPREVQAQLDYIRGWLRALQRKQLVRRKEMAARLDV